MFAIIQAAGWPIWPLLIASVIALALIIERLYSLRRTRVLPAGLLQSVLSTQAHGGYDATRLAALEESSPLGRVLAAGIRNQNSSREVMREAIEESGRMVYSQLERYLTTLGTIASIAPLLGLLGTLVGMIDIFGAQSPATGNPAIGLWHLRGAVQHHVWFVNCYSRIDLLAPLPCAHRQVCR